MARLKLLRTEILLEDWTVALITLVAVLILVPLVESILRRISREEKTPWQRLVACSTLPVSRLLYPIGLAIIIDAAPLEPKLQRWLGHFDFLLFVVFLVMLARRTSLWAIIWFASRHSTRNTEAALQHGFVPLLKNIVTLLSFLFGIISILKHFGYDIMSLVAALGVGSLAVGLAAQSTLSNMFAGFILIIDRNLRPGDRISIGGSVGVVQELGLRSTRLDLRDGNILIVPNSDLVNSRIINMSMTQNQFAAATKFMLPADVPFARIEKITTQVINDTPKAQKNRASSVLLASIANGYQVINASFGIVDPDDKDAALSQFHETLLKRLTSEGLSLVTPPVAPL
ncbi:MAG: mechanosensitive ion channel [Oligoflexia bacterium]|nr:mechanosensitive ion channel [Oligoflexia bacterium]